MLIFNILIINDIQKSYLIFCRHICFFHFNSSPGCVCKDVKTSHQEKYRLFCVVAIYVYFCISTYITTKYDG